MNWLQSEGEILFFGCYRENVLVTGKREECFFGILGEKSKD